MPSLMFQRGSIILFPTGDHSTWYHYCHGYYCYLSRYTWMPYQKFRHCTDDIYDSIVQLFDITFLYFDSNFTWDYSYEPTLHRSCYSFSAQLVKCWPNPLTPNDAVRGHFAPINKFKLSRLLIPGPSRSKTMAFVYVKFIDIVGKL